MGRHNITIPDSLTKRLEKHRDRINVSRICANAIEEMLNYLDKIEEIRKVGNKMDQLIERLKKEKSETSKEQFDHGLKVAKEWIEGAHYSLIRRWVDEALENDYPNWYHQNPPELPEDINGHNCEWWKEKRDSWKGHQQERLEKGEAEPSGDEEWIEFAKGFYTGLIEMWDAIESQL